MITKVKTAQEIKDMRTSGAMIMNVFDYLKSKTEIGTTTKQLADLAAIEIKKLGGESVLLGYSGFPDVICIAVNDEVVHGIPGRKVIEDGDKNPNFSETFAFFVNSCYKVHGRHLEVTLMDRKKVGGDA